MKRKQAGDFDQGLLDLYDRFIHGAVSRREFLDRATKYTVGGITAAALLDALSPRYALAQQVAPNDPRIKAEYITYPSPDGHGSVARASCPAREYRRKGARRGRRAREPRPSTPTWKTSRAASPWPGLWAWRRTA